MGIILLLLPIMSWCQQYVTCEFKGQLGNQMFELSAAIAYALDHHCTYSFPTLPQAINGELNMRYIFHRVNTDPFPENAPFYLYEHDRATDSHIYLPIPYFANENLKLDGHCISEKYFAHHRDTIRALFLPTNELIEEIRANHFHLLQDRTVAVHIRTYIPDHFNTICHTLEQFQWAKWHYFINAMNQFPSDSHFLLFSDDITYVKQHFPKLNKKITFIEGNPHYIDFYLMSLCDHQIVSPDSTFSWWAAWLNPNPNKIVIAPDLWWNMPHTDVVPDTWIKIPRYPKNTR